MVAALKDALFAALIMAGLAFPILALQAEPDITNTLVLQTRWLWLLIACAAVFVARLGYLALNSGPKKIAAVRVARADTATTRMLARVIGIVGVLALFVFPFAMLWYLGPQGSLKWINNYGVQILIYVMLGWGLNIVVGLAGLLDLGYVAFYAVGAYAYALLSTKLGLSFWICLPLAGILSAFWGIILGFPVLRLCGDYLAIVTLAFGEIIRIVLINWVDFSNAMPVSPRSRASPFSGCRLSMRKPAALPACSGWNSPRSTAPFSCIF